MPFSVKWSLRKKKIREGVSSTGEVSQDILMLESVRDDCDGIVGDGEDLWGCVSEVSEEKRGEKYALREG